MFMAMMELHCNVQLQLRTFDYINETIAPMAKIVKTTRTYY